MFPARVALVTKGQRVEPCLPQANRYLPRHDPLVALIISQHILMSHFLLCSSHSFWRYLGGADSKHGPCKPGLHPPDLTYSIPLLHPRRSEISKVLMLLARKGLSRARAQYASTLKNKGPLNPTVLTCVNPKCISYLRVDLNTYLTYYLRYKEGGQIR